MKPDQQPNIFRKESLEQVPSIERLDQLLSVVGRGDWLSLSALATLVTAIVCWSIFGRIPVKATGRGVLISPLQIVNIQSPIEGRLTKLHISTGDCVGKGEVLATVYSSEIQQKLELERLKLKQLQEQDNKADQLLSQRTELENSTIKQQALNLQQQLQVAQSVTQTLKEKEVEFIEQQRNTYNQQLQNARDLARVSKERWERRLSLLQEGAVSGDDTFNAELEYRRNTQEITNLEANLKQLNVQEIEAKQKYLTNLNNMIKLKADLEELKARQKRLAQENLEASTGRKNQIEETKRNIDQLEKEYEENRQIKSPYSGCILELTTNSGSVLSRGTQLASMQINSSNREVLSIAYFPVKTGKKIKSGMKLQVTPDTVRRERFGGILGVVTTTSTFPVTKTGAINVVGNSEVVDNLIREGEPVIEVRSKLQLNSSNPTGYEWSSSRGPDNLEISNGTTTTVRVTLESQAPITFIFPILKEWVGIY